MNRFLLFLLLVSVPFFAQEEAVIATYNLLNYDDTGRDDHFRVVMEALNPDMIVVQEILNQGDVSNFLNNVLNFTGDEYRAGLFRQSPFTSNALFYKHEKFSFVSNSIIPTDVRDINQFKVVYKATNDTLLIFSLHLKAGSTSQDQQQRLTEINLLRQVTDALPPQTDFMVAGDFNMQSSAEAAFQALLDFNQGAIGALVDPIDSPGNWNNNAGFRQIHSQSPRTTNFGGGASGGLDDRFDMVLVSLNIEAAGGVDYVSGSYHAFGNDGNHFNQAVNDGQNQDVGSDVANALHEASDHLPVLLKLRFETLTAIAETAGEIPQSLILHQNYPNPFNPSTTIEYELSKPADIQLAVYNILGVEVARIDEGRKPAGVYTIRFEARNLPGGIYYYQILNQVRKMILIK